MVRAIPIVFVVCSKFFMLLQILYICSSMSTVKASKAKLRKEVASVLKSVSADSIRFQSEIVAQKLLSTPYQQSQRVSVYLSTPTELCTVSILEDIFRSNKQCFVPRFYPKESKMEMVKLYSMEDFHTLPTVMWNIKQPKLDEIRENVFDSAPLDLILLPGVAFTNDGKRLGHGKGYYDSFLHEHRLKYGKLPYTIGLALKEQIYSDVPVTNYDVMLDQVIHG